MLQTATSTEEIDQSALSEQDSKFLSSLYSLMENELSNPELDVEKMAEALFISRSKLFYKVKGLTGETPIGFFKQYKLSRAAELLKEGKYPISQIADMTGFSSPSKFSSLFKKRFGVSPSDYKG
jgi:AraC-like DNA-binding protein